MNKADKLMSDIVIYNSYANYIKPLLRRENWNEIVNRTLIMHLKRFPKISKELTTAMEYVRDMKIGGSQRSLQFASDFIDKNNFKMYNCSFMHMNRTKSFSESMFVLLSGAGVGYSIQSRHVDQLPVIRKHPEMYKYLIMDSIEGWSMAVDVLIEAYMLNRPIPIFDFSAIRPEGSIINSTGSKSPSYRNLQRSLDNANKVLASAVGRKLKPIEVHDIMCHIAYCVQSGGIRRASLIALFDKGDSEMLTCKSGDWWVNNPQRAMANNSVILKHGDFTEEEFVALLTATKASRAGEPAISLTNDYDLGFNPCHEISLKNMQLCNLSTVNLTTVIDKKDFLKRCKYATVLGTVQSAYTNLPFVDIKWVENSKEDALIGISLTGIGDRSDIPDDWYVEGADVIRETNKIIAGKLGINTASRLTTLKPAGNSSAMMGTSSGVHARYSKYYIRNIRLFKKEALTKFLMTTYPELCVDDLSSDDKIIISIPQKSPDHAILRTNETALDSLKRIVKFNEVWIASGHIKGANLNNVSATVYVKDDEWDDVIKFMWDNRSKYYGISLFPYDEGTYKQAPFQECTEEDYHRLMKIIPESTNFGSIIEFDNTTDLMSEVACSGGVCEFK